MRVIHPIISRAGKNPAEQLHFHCNPGNVPLEKLTSMSDKFVHKPITQLEKIKQYVYCLLLYSFFGSPKINQAVEHMSKIQHQG